MAKQTHNKAISKALRQYDEGVPIPEILAAFPEESSTLSELFATIETLSQARGGTLPSPALLERILEDVSTAREDVTESLGMRSVYRRGDNNKGRSSIQETLYETDTVLMKSRSWLPLGVVAVLVIVFVAVQFGGSLSTTALNSQSVEDDLTGVDSAGDEIDTFLEGEIALSDIDDFLGEELEVTPQGPSIDPADIEADLNALDADDDLESFLDTEILLDLDSALEDF